MMGLVSQGCCNNGSQTRFLKMTQMYCLMVQREEVQSQGVCWLGVSPLETQAEDPSLPRPAPGGYRQPSANSRITASASVSPWPIPTSLSEFPPVPLRKSRVIGCRFHSDHPRRCQLKIFNPISFSRPFFHNKVTFTVSRGQDMGSHLGGGQGLTCGRWEGVSPEKFQLRNFLKEIINGKITPL